jgi:hypothetical protein
MLAGLEAWARFMGWYDFAIKKEKHVVWDMAWSQKADVSSEKEKSQKLTEDANLVDPMASVTVASHKTQG